MFDQSEREKYQNLPSVDVSHFLSPGVELLAHQQLGVRWMVHREKDDVPAPFYKEVREQGKVMYLSEITNCSQLDRPKGVKGGILAGKYGESVSFLVEMVHRSFATVQIL